MLQWVQYAISIGMGHNVTTDNMFHDFRDNTGHTNRSVVTTQIFLTLFKCRNNICLPPIAWHCPFIHRFLKDDSQRFGNLWTDLQDSWTEVIRTRCLSSEGTEVNLLFWSNSTFLLLRYTWFCYFFLVDCICPYVCGRFVQWCHN